jgi:hypothetical protein
LKLTISFRAPSAAGCGERSTAASSPGGHAYIRIYIDGLKLTISFCAPPAAGCAEVQLQRRHGPNSGEFLYATRNLLKCWTDVPQIDRIFVAVTATYIYMLSLDDARSTYES